VATPGTPGIVVAAPGRAGRQSVLWPRTAVPDVTKASDFVRAAGLQVTETGPRRVVGFLDLGPRYHTPWGAVHGGVYTTAVESAASIGASAAVADRGQFAVGANNTTDFLRSATVGAPEWSQSLATRGGRSSCGRSRYGVRRTVSCSRGQVRLQHVEPRPPR
jgi:uncharacterized protein (TIGR00369 family)